ncbi:MAG: M28 family metallopeptidase [Bacillota bacterium]
MRILKTIILVLVVIFLLVAIPVIPEKYLEPPLPIDEVTVGKKLSEELMELRGRGAGTPDEKAAAHILADQFALMGLEPLPQYSSYLQEFEMGGVEVIRDGDRLRFRTQGSSENTSQNVIGSLPGQDPEGKWIIFSAHYDGQGVIDGEIYPSANDNLSGIMVVTALARVLAAKPRINDTLVFIAFGAEEAGLLGSTHLAENLPVQPEQIRAVINLDTVGKTSPALHLYSLEDDALTKLLTAVLNRYGFQTETITPNRGLSDHYPFAKQGIKAVTIASSNWQEGNHTVNDTLDQIDLGQLSRLAAALKHSLLYLSR